MTHGEGPRPWEPVRVAIVGGGITALSLAHRLRERAGPAWASVTVLEASDRLGGKVVTYHDDDFTLEGGPDSFLNRKPEVRELAEALGLGDQLIETPAAHRRSFIYLAGTLTRPPKGLVFGVPTDLESLFASPLVSRAGKMRALEDLVLPRLLRDGQDVAVGDFLARRLGREIVTRLTEPILSGVYAGSAYELSLDAVAPQFREAERRRRSLIQGLKPQGQGSRPNAQDLGRGHSGGETREGGPPSVFSTLQSGLASLIQALERSLRAKDVELRTGHRGQVVRLARETDAHGEGAQYRLTLKTGESLSADHVILTVPAPDAAVLLEDVAPKASAELGAIRYVDVALVGLGYRTGDVDPLAGSGYVVPRDQDLPVTATTWVSQKWPGTAPDGHVLIRVYLGRSGDAPVLTHSDEGLLTLARASVRKTIGERRPPVLSRVIRVPRALPQYAVGHLERIARAEAELSALPGLYATGAAFYGVGLPDLVRQAQKTAERVVANLLPGGE